MGLNTEPATAPDLRRSVFLPLAGTVLVLFLALGLAILWNQARNEADKLDGEIDATANLFELRLAGDVEAMRMAMELMLSDPAILDPFMAGDLEGLSGSVNARFEDLRASHGISHMYFVGGDRVTFLRVHQPQRRGDVIDRFTMREAQRNNREAHGLGLGPLGTLTLRVVIPLRHEGRVIGYLEFGREVEQYTADIRKTLHTELYILIRKELLAEEQWAEGQTMLGRDADWARFDNFVATGSADAGDEGSVALDEAVQRVSQAPTDLENVELEDGSYITLGARPLRDASGREVGLLVASLDMTASTHTFQRTLLGFAGIFLVFATAMVLLLHRVVDRASQGLRHAEATERRAKEQLEQRVRERTAQLEEQIAEREKAEARLRQAQRMEVVGQLTEGVAHDFNNLLAIIMGDLELLRDQLDDDELIAGAWEATERGATLVAGLLAFSRKQALSPRPVDLQRLIDELMPQLERSVPENVRIQHQHGEQLWSCLVDDAQLERLISNLVVNGREAMPEGGTLTITTANRCVLASEADERSIEPGDYVELTVTDTGTGMSSDVLARAFDPFFTTKEVGRGSGLGLSMVHGTIKQSGGHVELDSAPNEGTTVRLLLPRAGTDTSS